jgi:general secretion pathway protein M
MKEQLARLQAALLQLNPRERIAVGAAAVVVTLTLLFLLVWGPLAGAHRDRAEALQQARAQAQQIERAAALIATGTSGGRTANLSTSLLTAVDTTSRSPVLGKAPSRVQPEGDSEVKVWIENVPFANVLRWLDQLQTQYAISASSVEIERGDVSGQVSGRLTLVRQ